MAEMQHYGQSNFADFAAAEAADARVRAERIAVTQEQSDWDVANQALNDDAEMRVYGSRGRTYYDADGEVLADAENPIPSFADQIRTSRTITVSERERNDEGELEHVEVELELSADPRERERIARQYEDDVRSLTEDEGLDLFQAQQLAEDHVRNQARLFDMANQFAAGAEAGGRYDPDTGRRDAAGARMDADEAVARAERMYERREQMDLRDALLTNPYTRDEVVAERAPSAREQALIDASRTEVADEAADIRDARGDGTYADRAPRGAELEDDDDDADELDRAIDDEEDDDDELDRLLREEDDDDGEPEPVPLAPVAPVAPAAPERRRRLGRVLIGLGAAAVAAAAVAAIVLENRTGVKVVPTHSKKGSGTGTTTSNPLQGLNLQGEYLWNVLRDNGVAAKNVMGDLHHALKVSGHPYKIHNPGTTHEWYQVQESNGKWTSGTKQILGLIGNKIPFKRH